jgi:pimeloyl-ACP methyl ester carboxylesterase
MKHRVDRLAVLPLALAWVAVGAAQNVRSELFDANQLLRDLRVLSADDMQGRRAGTPGGLKARAYVVERFKASGILSFGASYEHPFALRRQASDTDGRTGANVVGRIDGTRAQRRYIVVTAHYDHIGIASNGQVFNGADDNASGTAALFALAGHFRTKPTANSLIFAALDGEESGLEGARAFVQTPPVEAGALVLNLNLDMIGRDPDDTLYVVGTRQQPFLKPFIERIASKAPVRLVMGHDDPAQKENWFFQSDHHAFCQVKIPCLYFGVEDFGNHHKTTDDYETMTYSFFVRAVETAAQAIREFDAGLDEIARVRGEQAAPAPAQAAPVPTPGVADLPVEITVPGGKVLGSLVMPTPAPGQVPVALIIAGSGPTDRDGNSGKLKNNMYRMLAEALAAQGIASVRYDKRGVAASVIKDLKEADLRFDDFVRDASAWITQLRNDSRFASVTVVGHSEGSLIGMLAARAAKADAFISVAGIARRPSDVLRDQLKGQLSSELAGASEQILQAIEAGKTTAIVPTALAALYRPSVQPYLISWFAYIPSVEIAALRVPTLIVHGTTDIQVPVPEAEALKAARPEATLRLIEGMNHVLKTAPIDRPANIATYVDPERPLAPELAPALVSFIRGVRPPRHPETTRRSPRTVVTAVIGGARLAIEYGQPAKRGRDIWGALVPYGRWWMPGADETTTITTNREFAAPFTIPTPTR